MSSQSRKSKGNIKYCRECGAEVYENEKRCWNCNAKTTDRKKLCIVLSVLCVIFAITSVVGLRSGLSTQDKGTDVTTTTEVTSEDSQAVESEAKTEKKEKKKEEILDVDALEFVTLHSENLLSFSKKYDEKKIRLSGTIFEMEVNPYNSSEWLIYLSSGYSEYLSDTAVCILSSKGKDKIESYKKGDSITVSGTVDISYPYYATLKSCDIEE